MESEARMGAIQRFGNTFTKKNIAWLVEKASNPEPEAVGAGRGLTEVKLAPEFFLHRWACAGNAGRSFF